MRELFTKDCIRLGAGQAVSGIAATARTVRVSGGRVWITVEGRPEDYWLGAGETFAAEPGRLIVIEATDTASTLHCTPPRQRRAGLKLELRLGGRLGRLLQHLVPARFSSAALPCKAG